MSYDKAIEALQDLIRDYRKQQNGLLDQGIDVISLNMTRMHLAGKIDGVVSSIVVLKRLQMLEDLGEDLS